MSFNKFQIDAVKKIQDILKLEFINPEQVKKEISIFQSTLKNIKDKFSKEFSKINNEFDSNNFILSYLSKSVSKESFAKIKSNYEKTKEIVFSREATPINKATKENTLDSLFSLGAKSLGIDLNNVEGVLDNSKTMEISNDEIAKIANQITAEKLLSRYGKEKLDEAHWTKEDNDKFLEYGVKMVTMTDEEIEKELIELRKKDPEFAKKLDIILSDDTVEENENLNDYEEGYRDGQKHILEQLNLPSVDEMNIATGEWKKQKQDPSIQNALKQDKPVTAKKPFMKSFNGNCIMTSEIKANKINIKDPKKCFLLFIDEEGKVHQLTQSCLEKGQYKIDKKNGIIKDKTKELTK